MGVPPVEAVESAGTRDQRGRVRGHRPTMLTKENCMTRLMQVIMMNSCGRTLLMRGIRRLSWAWLAPALGLVIAVTAGCNQYLAEYQRIELGRPLDGNTTLTTTTAPSEGGQPMMKRETFVFPLPSIVAFKGLGVLVGRDGNVVAKEYKESAFEHWLVAQVGAYRYYFEVEIPPECFHEVPEGWKDIPSSFDAWMEMQWECRVLSEGLPDSSRGLFGTMGGGSFREYAETLDMPINPNRLRPGVAERITAQDPAPLVDPQRDIDMTCVDAAKFLAAKADFHLVKAGQGYRLRAILRAPRNADHVPAYLDYVTGQMESAMPSSETPNLGCVPLMMLTGFQMAMYFGGRTTWPGAFVNHPEDFQGVTREGFDRQFDFRDGGKARIRNLGNRRIRVEFEFLRIIDPFFIIPMIEMGGSEHPKPKVETRYR